MKKSVYSEKYENREGTFSLPKNAKRLDPSVIEQMTPTEQKEYQKVQSRPKKVGYAIISNKFNRYYKISIIDFIPFFIGSIISIVRFCISYGDIKQSINMNKRLIWDFKINFSIGMVYSFLFIPLVLILIGIAYPFLVLDVSEVSKGWVNMFDTFSEKGIFGFGDALNSYYQKIIVGIFQPRIQWITIVMLICVSTINTKTIVFFFLLKTKRNQVFSIQKEAIKNEIIKFQMTSNKKSS